MPRNQLVEAGPPVPPREPWRARVDRSEFHGNPSAVVAAGSHW